MGGNVLEELQVALNELMNSEEGVDPDAQMQLDTDRAEASSKPFSTQMGSNDSIRKHMNRQKFGALSKGKARRNRTVDPTS